MDLNSGASCRKIGRALVRVVVIAAVVAVEARGPRALPKPKCGS